jgi:hypothetical protein
MRRSIQFRADLGSRIPYFSAWYVRKSCETEAEEMVTRILLGEGDKVYVLEVTAGSVRNDCGR